MDISLLGATGASLACSTGIADVATAGVSLVAATGISLSGAAPDIVVEFTAMHDFGDGVKGAGFKLKEMGEDGRGSLEPGVASGSEFIMAYPLPFLEHYFFQNRLELPDAVRVKAFPADAVIAAGAVDGGAADEQDTGGDGELVEVQQEKAAILDLFELRSSVRAARQPRQSCTRMTLACSTPRETQRATWFRLPAARVIV